MGNVVQGNSSRWRKEEKHITICVNPASSDGSHTFSYADPVDSQIKQVGVTRIGGRVRLTAPALSTASTARIFLDRAPVSVSVKGNEPPWTFNDAEASLEFPIESNTPIDVEIGL